MSRLSQTEHAYKPSLSGSVQIEPPSLEPDVPTTAVALWFEIPSSRQADENSMMVAAWALQGEKSLIYASFQDSLPDFTIISAWLRQYKPASVYWAFKNTGKNQSVTACNKVIEWMEGLAENLAVDPNNEASDSQNGAGAPLNVSVTPFESNLFKDSHRTIPALLQSLVEGNSAAKYALAANVDLTSNGKSTSLCSALAVLWHGLGHGMNDTVSGFEIARASRAPFLVLDRAAATSLNIWPVAHQGQAAAQGITTDKDSLYGLLSKPCETPGGKRLLKRWLQQPLTCLETLKQRQEAVVHLVAASVERDSLRSTALATLQVDLANLARKLAQYEHCKEDADLDAEKSNFGSTRKALQTLYELYVVASQKIPAITEQVELVAAALDESAAHVLWKTWRTVLPQLTVELQRSVALVEAVLDLEQAPREFLVQASYHPDLADLKQELEEIELQVDEAHAEMNQLWADAAGKSSDSQEVRLEYDANDSKWEFRLPKANDAKVLQTQLDNHVTVSRLLKNGVYFSNKSIRQLSEQKRKLLSRYDKYQRQVARDAVQVGATYHAVVAKLSRVISQIDVVAALAHVSAYNNYCRPELADSEEDGMGIQLEEARHPCVELQENVEFIPNNVNLIYGESSFLIVTGPNMGGKSTYIRALGASVVLAQIGCYVPATKARINLCHHLLARVGAGDLPDRGISTFMAEMLEASSILQQASRRSLIMIDELGRGTSTFDGYGLARSIAEHIVDEIGCLAVFATHFHELTALEEKKMVKNAHVSAQKGQHGLTFMYQVKPGPCLESFGIQVAEMANVPKVVVEDAKRKAKELERFEYSHQTAEEDKIYVDGFANLDLDALLTSHGNDAEKQASLKKALYA